MFWIPPQGLGALASSFLAGERGERELPPAPLFDINPEMDTAWKHATQWYAELQANPHATDEDLARARLAIRILEALRLEPVGLPHDVRCPTCGWVRWDGRSPHPWAGVRFARRTCMGRVPDRGRQGEDGGGLDALIAELRPKT